MPPPWYSFRLMARNPTHSRGSPPSLCRMPACVQAVGYGVCDPPELWRGAAGLCARVRACAGAAESLHAYIHPPLGTLPVGCLARTPGRRVELTEQCRNAM